MRSILTSDLIVCFSRRHRNFLFKMDRNLRWSVEEESFLIDFHRSNQFLWDPKHPDYFNKHLRNSKLSDLSELLESVNNRKIEIPEIKRKWRNLRTSFFREHKKSKILPSDSSGSSIYNCRWTHYREMMFLNDISCDESTDSLPLEISQSQSMATDEIEFPNDCVTAVEDVNSTALTSTLVEENQTSSSSSSSSSKNKDKSLPTEVLQSCKNIMETILNKKQPQDGVDLFMGHAATVLRKLNLVKQQEAILEMQGILVKYLREQQAENGD